jgi:predicted MPP superfamily phosphohydrolase
MKIALASDIHLEFGDINLKNEENADLLILSGDICQARDAGKATPKGDIVRDFFQRVSFQFPQVIYIMGNHEHYSGDYAKSAGFMRNMFGYHNLNNVTLLDRECITIDDYLFIGGTLWTDFNKHDPLTLHSAETMMNDYRGIKNTNDKNIWKFLPRHALEEHVKTKGYIKTVLDNRRAEGRRDNKVVVVGHHAPSFASVAEYYKGDTIMNGCFASELSEFILDYPEIQLWTHGHMHDPSDYMIGSTRIVCNPRGYVGYEHRADIFALQYLEV